MQALAPLHFALLLSPIPLLTALNKVSDVPFLPLPGGCETTLPVLQPDPQPPNNALPSVPPPYDSDVQDSSYAVVFSKYLYSSAPTKSAKELRLADHFRTHCVLLNQDGMLGDTLSIVYDMRPRDLQTSINLKNARKMKEFKLLDILAAQYPTHS
jgi:hypothetical protein